MKFITLHGPDNSEVDILASSIVRIRTVGNQTHLDLMIGLQIVKESRAEVIAILKSLKD